MKAPLIATASLRDRLADRALRKTAKAVDLGLLDDPKTLTCADCGDTADFYDHRDYRRPLSVDPVCKACNNRRGPGLPLPTSVDAQHRRSDFTIENGGSSGLRWNAVEGGEGYSPLEARLAESPQIRRAIERSTVTEVGAWLVFAPSNGSEMNVPTAAARDKFFKFHDPWADPPHE